MSRNPDFNAHHATPLTSSRLPFQSQKRPCGASFRPFFLYSEQSTHNGFGDKVFRVQRILLGLPSSPQSRVIVIESWNSVSAEEVCCLLGEETINETSCNDISWCTTVCRTIPSNRFFYSMELWALNPTFVVARSVSRGQKIAIHGLQITNKITFRLHRTTKDLRTVITNYFIVSTGTY